MQAMRISPDISVMWREQYSAGAGYIRQLAVKGLRAIADEPSKIFIVGRVLLRQATI